MTFNLKSFLKTTLAASLTFPILTAGTSVFAEEQPSQIEAEAALLVDFETGQILYDQNADSQRGIASMTKMLVEYILFEEIEAGNLTWDTEVSISDYAHQVSQNYTLSNVPLRSDYTYTVQELYEALAIYSANGATIALAEEIEGSEQAFVDRMRQLVESWGIEEFELYNTTGLNNSSLFGNHYPGSDETAENIMSAKSMAIVAQKILEDYPEVLETSSIPTKVFREGTPDAISMLNWNWMLEGLSHERLDVDGLKTGTTEFAGATFTGTASSDGRRLISVVMGAGDGFADRGLRFDETSKLLDYGFNGFDHLTLIEADDSVDGIEPISVKNGVEDEVTIVSTESLSFYLPKGTDTADIQYTFEPNEEFFNDQGQLEAPIDAGTVVGQLVVEDNDMLQFIDGDTEQVVPVATSQSVERAGFFTILINWVSDFFGGLRNRF